MTAQINPFTQQTELGLRGILTAGAPEIFDMPPMDKILPTDYGAFVLDTITLMTRQSKCIDQAKLRQCIRLACSFLITDTTMNPEKGLSTWARGLSRLVDVVVALHKRDELEVATISEASKACRECWVAAGAFKGLEECRNRVREDGTKLKGLLDADGRSYKGEPVS